jgi:hypothetical protein
MANEVTDPRREYDPYQEHADEVASRAHITGDLLRFTKHGQYKAGADQDEVDEGTRMLVYMPSLKKGWVKWYDGQPVQHIVGLVAEGYKPPERHDLGDMDESEWGELNGRPIDPWQKTNYIVMLDEDGQLYTFVTSSKGGLSAVGEICDAYAKRRRMKPDEIPVIELHSRSYMHKDYGETFAPTLKITGWAKVPENFNELQEAIGSDEPVEFTLPAPAPAKAAAAPAKPAVVKSQAPKGRASSKTPPTKGGKRPVKF